MIDTRPLGALLRAVPRDERIGVRDRVSPPASVGAASRVTHDAPRAPDTAIGPLQTPDSSESAPLALSDTGKLLLAILRAAPQAQAGALATPNAEPHEPRNEAARAPTVSDGARVGPTQTPVRQSAPLLSVAPGPGIPITRVALEIGNAVEFSGVFYEAHLAQWAEGARPRPSLASEPQSQWAPESDAGRDGNAALPADAPRVLRQQLDVLETGRFVWSGSLWPGQPGELAIEEDGPREPTTPGGIERCWRIDVALELPTLGPVVAHLTLRGQTLNLALDCVGDDAASRLRASAPMLQAALGARDLELERPVIA